MEATKAQRSQQKTAGGTFQVNWKQVRNMTEYLKASQRGLLKALYITLILENPTIRSHTN